MSTTIQHATDQHVSETTEVANFGQVSDIVGDLTPKEAWTLARRQVYISSDGQIDLSGLKSWAGIKSRATEITPAQARKLFEELRHYAEMYHSPEMGASLVGMLGDVARFGDRAQSVGVVREAAEAWGRGEGWLSDVAFTRIVTASTKGARS